MWQHSLLIWIVGITAVVSMPINAAELIDGTLFTTAYQQLQLMYIDGVEHPFTNGNTWNQTDSASLTETNRLIAVKAAGDDNCGGILASFGDSYVLTNGEWKCNRYTESNWFALGFNDANWAFASEFGTNVDGHSKCGQLWGVPEISPNAKWIWTANQTTPSIYCRGYIPVCDSSPCKNNGTCLQNNAKICSCVPQFTGTFCETETTPEATMKTTETPTSQQTTNRLQTTEGITTNNLPTTEMITLPQTTQEIFTTLETTMNTTETPASQQTTIQPQTTEGISTNNLPTTESITLPQTTQDTLPNEDLDAIIPVNDDSPS